MQDTVAAGFALWQVQPHIDSAGDQVLEINLPLSKKKDSIVRMKQNMFFTRSLIQKLTGKLKIESLE